MLIILSNYKVMRYVEQALRAIKCETWKMKPAHIETETQSARVVEILHTSGLLYAPASWRTRHICHHVSGITYYVLIVLSNPPRILFWDISLC